MGRKVALNAFIATTPTKFEDMSSEKLREFLEKGKDWERRPTNIPGVFVLKLPADRRRAAQLAVEINPVDEFGRPTKKKGLLLRSLQEFKVFKALINEKRVEVLMELIESVNPRREGGEESGGEVIEIG